jgi:hypothetical protein
LHHVVLYFQLYLFPSTKLFVWIYHTLTIHFKHQHKSETVIHITHAYIGWCPLNTSTMIQIIRIQVNMRMNIWTWPRMCTHIHILILLNIHNVLVLHAIHTDWLLNIQTNKRIFLIKYILTASPKKLYS